MPPACLEPGFQGAANEMVTYPLLALGKKTKATGVAEGHWSSGLPADPAASPGMIATLLYKGDPFLGLVCTPEKQVL